MKSYDKAAWHIDGGENPAHVIKRFKEIFLFLSEKKMLTTEGVETLEYCMDSSVSLNSTMVNLKGVEFLDSCYDMFIDRDTGEIRQYMENAYKDFISKK